MQTLSLCAAAKCDIAACSVVSFRILPRCFAYQNNNGHGRSATPYCCPEVSAVTELIYLLRHAACFLIHCTVLIEYNCIYIYICAVHLYTLQLHGVMIQSPSRNRIWTRLSITCACPGETLILVKVLHTSVSACVMFMAPLTTNVKQLVYSRTCRL